MRIPSSRIGSHTAFVLACAALFAVTLPAVRAQSGNTTVAASLADPSVEAGQPAEYHIDVVNGRTEHPPPAPVVDGLTITYTGQSSSRQINFGNGFQMQQTVTTTYVYSVETSRAGHFTIPGQQIEVGGTDLRTLPITLTVLDAGGAGAESSGQSLAAELIIPKKSAYVGESIPGEVRTYFGLALRFNPDPDPILNGEGFSAQKFTKPRTIETQVVEGTQVHSVSYKTAITGVKLGALSVGPVELQPVVQAPRPRQRRRGFNNPFDDPFFNNALDGLNMAPPKQVKLHTGTANIEIKPLPSGKPADFSGAIGTFRLEAEADPRKAQAGDPVTVRLVLSGQGNFDRIAAPTLSDEHGLRTYPANSKFKADDEVSLSGVKTFEQVVIAEGARSALPPYHFSYLNPETGKYVVIDTPPIPVEITGGSAPPPAASNTVAEAATPTPTPVPSRPPKPAEDILYIRTDPGAARSAADFQPPFRRRGFWLVQGGVLLGMLGLAALGTMRARARDEKARRLALLHRQKTELQRALQREDTGRGEFYVAATQLARLKAAVAAGEPGASFSVADVCRASGLDAQAAGSVAAIFQRHDELAYSGGRAAQELVPADERRGVLATLETLGKH